MYNYGFRNIFKKVGSSGTPVPSAGSYVPLSWTGDTSVFDFGIASGTENNFNSIQRTSASTSFIDRTIESVQTVPYTQAFTFSCDLDTGNNTSCWYSIGQTGLHHTGITFSDLEYALWGYVSGSNIVWEWREFGTKIADMGTTVKGEKVCISLEYDGSNGITALVNNGELSHTTTTSYTSEDLAIYLLGRLAFSEVGDHIALKTVAQPNRIMLSFGDSITFGGAAVGGYSSADGSSYVAKTIAYTNHRHFACPVLADPGDTTALVISDQIPRASDYYDASYDSNLATLMIGINDLNLSVSLATIQSNISSIVSSLQTDGFTVVICTVIRDHSGADMADRGTLNTWINAGNSGADYVCDLTGTDLETNTALFESDLLHPNPDGMTVIAENLWLITKDL
jgi:lysophospholipase L1-like esterase